MRVNLSITTWLLLLPSVVGLTVSERAQTARGRLLEALSSPSGKLTLSPEVVIPEPSDPTAILLQTSEIATMSEKIRIKAKANAAFISGAVTSLRTFCNEQEQARGNFPGPVPVIYCDQIDDLESVSEAGAEGILVPVCGGQEVASLADLEGDNPWADRCKSALESGVQPIPEVTISEKTAAKWKGSDVEALVAKICDITGEDPVSVLLTVSVEEKVDSDADESEEEDEEDIELMLPEVPKSIGKRTPILGSITAKAGAGRMGVETTRFKGAGFTGAVLRKECITAISMSQSLEYLGDFWSACIGDLKSLKSKTFEFRSKNMMEKSVPLEWMKYQQDVMSSGALGEMEDNVPMGLNPDAGDYQGF